MNLSIEAHRGHKLEAHEIVSTTVKVVWDGERPRYDLINAPRIDNVESSALYCKNCDLYLDYDMSIL